MEKENKEQGKIIVIKEGGKISKIKSSGCKNSILIFYSIMVKISKSKKTMVGFWQASRTK